MHRLPQARTSQSGGVSTRLPGPLVYLQLFVIVT